MTDTNRKLKQKRMIESWKQGVAELEKAFYVVNEATHRLKENPLSRYLGVGMICKLNSHTTSNSTDGKKMPIADSNPPVFNSSEKIAGVALTTCDKEEARLNQRFIETRLSLIKYAADHTSGELLTRVLDEIGTFVDSPIGFYHFVEPDQKTISFQQWSTRTLKEFCRAEGKGVHYDIDDAGVWVDCVKEGKPVIHNDYVSLPHKKGLPEGHAPVVRELVAPVLRDGKVVAILGVGNKPVDYTQDDVKIVSFLADVTWEIVNRKRAEEELQHSNDMLRAIIDTAPVAIVGLDQDANVHSVWNKEAEKMFGWRAPEVMGFPLPILPANRWEAFRAFRERTRNSLTHDGVEVPVLRRDGGLIDCSLHATPLRDKDGNIIGDIGVLVDITDKKTVERERLARLKYFENMDRINRTIQGASDLDQMMGDVLDEVLSIFDCDRAFLMYPCDPDSQTWTSPMERNKPEYPGVLELNCEIPMDPQVAETLRILLAANGPVTFGPSSQHVLPEDVSKQFKIKSFMGMAIYPKAGSPWQFGIHQCSHPRVWTAEEMKLFQEAGRRLADGLTSMLMYRDLQESEKFLNNILENIPDMIFVKEAETLKYLRLNRAGEMVFGFSRDELLGKTNYDLFPKEKADFFAENDRRVLETKALLDIPEEKIIAGSNDDRIVHTKLLPLLDETGEPQYILGISEDITERRRMDESIRKLTEAIAQSPVSIVITDASGVIEFVNRKFTEITGYSQSEVLGKNPRVLKSGETPPEGYKRLWESISSGEVWKGEFCNRKKDGDLFWEHATIAPIRDSENIITHYVGIKEDITERKILEEQFHQAQKMESIGRLAGGVAHDFNNLLSVIMGNTELALDKADQDRQIGSYLQRIQKAAEHSADLVKQLLAFARKQTIAPRILDLDKTVDEMLKMIRRLIGEDINLSWRPVGKVWPVKMDPSQVGQILANLCINARDAIEDVGDIIIETENIILDKQYCALHTGFKPGSYAMLVVSDNGCGMDRETIDKIFEPFFTTKELGKGTGLGLATVYGIVKQNNGFINVYSEPGQGTTFKIFLPRHKSKGDQVQVGRKAPSIARGHETILVVEDEPAILNLANEMLRTLGYRVLTGKSPDEAIRVTEEYGNDIHLMITDVIMPGMNGPDLTNQIRSIYPKIKTLFMSGYTEDTIGYHGVLDDDVYFIQKPFSLQSLSEKIRDVLDRG